MYTLTTQVPGLTMPQAEQICVDAREVAGLIGALQQLILYTVHMCI